MVELSDLARKITEIEQWVNGFAATISRISVLENQIQDIRRQLEERLEAQREATELALSAAEKTTSIAQNTADRAVAKAEAAAGKEYLESQIEGLRTTINNQIENQKQAMTAALMAAREALTAALNSSEKAIQKAETANEARFQSVNEFREQLNDQTKLFASKSECTIQFQNIDKQVDEIAIWRREVDLKFANYVTVIGNNQVVNEWTVWRRTVDAALTAASSRTGLMTAIVSMAIGAGGLLIALFTLFTKTTGSP